MKEYTRTLVQGHIYSYITFMYIFICLIITLRVGKILRTIGVLRPEVVACVYIHTHTYIYTHMR